MELKLLLRWYILGLATSVAACLCLSYGLHILGAMSFEQASSIVISLACLLLILVLSAITMMRMSLPRPELLEKMPEDERNYYAALRERLTTAVIAILLVAITMFLVLAVISAL
ncbi:hypothetical protein DRO33_04020 [Candidatus Bathyarchaeota archaeon]|nr:MAG: hypothetical protein DRO33_04020 [Candidatus Bathyarchaeota archaeon]